MSIPIVYCMMAQNNLYQLEQAVDRVVPYVDKTVIIDGGSNDCSLFYLRGREEEGIHTFLHPWQDVFSDQRNNYLKRAREVMKTDTFWILCSDPDEHFSLELLGNLRELQAKCVLEGYNSVRIRCRSVTLRGKKRILERLDDFYKLLFFAYSPDIHYIGNPHETLVFPYGGPKAIQTDYLYEHIKWENVVWERGVRNSYINGGGANVGSKNPLWVELKKNVICHYERDLSWKEYQDELIKGTIPDTIKEWMINKARLETGWHGSSEIRAHYTYFFRFLHKELEPEELKNVHIEDDDPI